MNTRKKLLSGLLLRLDFPFKNQSFTKHRKMQHWTQHKNIRSIFSLHFLAALGFPKTGNDGNGEAVLGILDGNVKDSFRPTDATTSEMVQWSREGREQENQMHAQWCPSPHSLAEGSGACWCAMPLHWRRTLSQWISGRPFSSGRQCTTCHDSPSRRLCGTSSPRPAPSGWGADMEKSTG